MAEGPQRLSFHPGSEDLAAFLKVVQASALRSAARELTDLVEGIQGSDRPNTLSWQTGALASRDFLRNKAEHLASSP